MTDFPLNEVLASREVSAGSEAAVRSLFLSRDQEEKITYLVTSATCKLPILTTPPGCKPPRQLFISRVMIKFSG